MARVWVCRIESVVPLVLLALVLVAGGCGGSGGSNSSDTSSSTGQTPTSPELGSVDNPIELQEGSNPISVTGKEATGYAGLIEFQDFFKFTASQSRHYTLSTVSSTVDVAWALTDDRAYDTVVDTCDAAGVGVSDTCLTEPLNAGQTYYLAVGNTYTYDASATVTISPSGSPTALALGSNGPYDVTVGGALYFTFMTGGTPGAYTISATLSHYSDLSWYLLDSASFDTTPLTSCDTVAGGSSTESCVTPALAASTTYYLTVADSSQDFTSGGGLPVSVTIATNP